MEVVLRDTRLLANLKQLAPVGTGAWTGSVWFHRWFTSHPQQSNGKYIETTWLQFHLGTRFFFDVFFGGVFFHTHLFLWILYTATVFVHFLSLWQNSPDQESHKLQQFIWLSWEVQDRGDCIWCRPSGWIMAWLGREGEGETNILWSEPTPLIIIYHDNSVDLFTRAEHSWPNYLLKVSLYCHAIKLQCGFWKGQSSHDSSLHSQLLGWEQTLTREGSTQGKSSLSLALRRLRVTPNSWCAS